MQMLTGSGFYYFILAINFVSVFYLLLKLQA